MISIGRFFQYLALYLSVALIGGAIVHFPVNPTRFGAIGAVGLIIFVISSFFEAKAKKKQGQLNIGFGNYLLLSFMLSLGLGMLSGSIQHFLDTPFYAALLIPLGLILAFIAYTIREQTEINKSKRWVSILVVIVSALILAYMLYQFAHMLDAGHHGHSGHKH